MARLLLDCTILVVFRFLLLRLVICSIAKTPDDRHHPPLNITLFSQREELDNARGKILPEGRGVNDLLGDCR
jgi:hypothetical protein